MYYRKQHEKGPNSSGKDSAKEQRKIQFKSTDEDDNIKKPTALTNFTQWEKHDDIFRAWLAHYHNPVTGVPLTYIL